MRHSPAVCSTVRTVNEDVELGGYTFPAGTYIFVNSFAANRDPAIYPDPERFDITRRRPAGDTDVRRRRALLPRREPRQAGARRSPQDPVAPDARRPTASVRRRGSRCSA